MIRFTEDLDYGTPGPEEKPIELELYLKVKVDSDNVFMTCKDQSCPIWHLQFDKWNIVSAGNNIATAWRLYFEDKYQLAYDEDDNEYLYYI